MLHYLTAGAGFGIGLILVWAAFLVLAQLYFFVADHMADILTWIAMVAIVAVLYAASQGMQ